MLEAMGVRFYNTEGETLNGNGCNLSKMIKIDTSQLQLPHDLEIKVICDVDNPLLGPNGATKVFAPQKGATAKMIWNFINLPFA